MHDYTTAIFINAPATQVWQVITDPQTLKQSTTGDIETDWQQGSPLRITYVWEGQTYVEKGTITRSDPCKILQLSYLPIIAELEDKPENYQHVSLYVDEMDTGTHVRVELQNILGDFLSQRAPEIWGEILHYIKEASES